MRPSAHANPREHGNQLFKVRDFSGAEAAYSQGLAQPTATGTVQQQRDERAALLSNRAACRMELGDLSAAAEDCRASLTLQPGNAKAHYRLARSLPPGHPEAGKAACIAVALIQQGDRSAALLQTYAKVQRATAAAAAAEAERPETEGSSSLSLLQLPEDASLVVSAGCWDEAARAVKRGGAAVIVLLPGVHVTSGRMPERAGRLFGGSCGAPTLVTILGLGNVTLRAPPYCGHAVWVGSAETSFRIVNARLEGGPAAAAFVSSPGALLQLVDCRVEDHPEAGLLVSEGGRAELWGCAFRRTTAQAIEVREGGQLAAGKVTIEACRQGVSAYGGARAVRLWDCNISGCSREGVLAAGTFTNAATEAQHDGGLSHRGKAQPADNKGGVGSRKVTELAEARGRRLGVALDVTLLRCTVAGCALFGISADSGVRLILQQCRLEHNDPYALLIKGGSDASVRACQVLYTGAKSKCNWGGLSAKDRQEGIHVGVNYSGGVVLFGTAFCGPKDLAVREEAADIPATMRQMGMWSKPATVQLSRHFPLAASLPSLAELACGLPDLAGSLQRRRPAAPPPLPSLQRICSTFQQASWSPASHQFYAIGNTLGYDVTGGLLPNGVNRPRIFLGACGDIRNLLATVHSALGPPAHQGSSSPWRTATTPSPSLGPASAGSDDSGGGDDSGAPRTARTLACVMNDGNISVLARDAVLLHMAAEQGESPEAVLAVWSSHGLSTQHGQLLARSLWALAEEPWPAWLSCASSLGADPALGGPEGGAAEAEAEEALRGALRAWAACSVTLPELLERREQVVGASTMCGHALSLSMEAIKASLGATAAEKLRPEVAEYIKCGSLCSAAKEPLTAANHTFLLAPELQYTVYFSSSIFRALALGPGATAKARLLATLIPQLDTVASALRSGTLHVSLILGDILTAMTTPSSPYTADPKARAGEDHDGLLFDFIDCSNVADYISVPALVQAAAPLLAVQPYSRLRLESLLAFGRERQRDATLSPHDFAARSLGGVPLSLFEALTGLHLAGAVSPLPKDARSAVRLEWRQDPNRLLRPELALSASDQKLFGASEGADGLTAASLLLDLLSACKRGYVTLDAAGSRNDAALVEVSARAAPATLVHLLSLADPQSVGPLVRALVRCGGAEVALFKWEMTSLAQVQSQHHAVPGSQQAMHRLLYSAKAGFSLPAWYSDDRLLLAITRDAPAAPHRPGTPSGVFTQGCPLSKQAIKQLVSSFAWDEEMGAAHWLLPQSLVEQCGSWYVTLCVLRDGGGGPSGGGGSGSSAAELLAVGVPATIASLPAAAEEVTPWCRLPPSPAAPLLQLDMGLVDQARPGAPSPRAQSGCWQAKVGCLSPSGVTVDVLAPGPLPSVGEAAVTAFVAGDELKVTVRPKGSGGGGGHFLQEPQQGFTVQLPADRQWHDSKMESVKLSRSLGLLSLRQPRPCP